MKGEIGLMEYKNFIKGKKIRSLNWYLGGNSKQGKLWRWNEAKKERQDMKLEIEEAKKKEPLKNIQPPYEILLFRIAPGEFDKEDNLTGGFKHIRDGIADGLGYSDDSHPDLTWIYKQIKCKKYQEAINIIIRHKQNPRQEIVVREVNND